MNNSTTSISSPLSYGKSILAVVLPIFLFVFLTLVLTSNLVPKGTIAALWIYFLLPAIYVSFKWFSNKPIFAFATTASPSHHSDTHTVYVPTEEDLFIIESYQHHLQHHTNPIKDFTKVFWILLVITVGEIGIAYSSMPKSMMASIFILLTFVKAYYIGGTFMHLKDETKSLIRTLVLPILFLLWFVFITMNESSYIYLHRLFD